MDLGGNSVSTKGEALMGGRRFAMKWNKPKLIQIGDGFTSGDCSNGESVSDYCITGSTVQISGGGCTNGETNIETCGGGSSVIPNCSQGGIPTVSGG